MIPATSREVESISQLKRNTSEGSLESKDKLSRLESRSKKSRGHTRGRSIEATMPKEYNAINKLEFEHNPNKSIAWNLQQREIAMKKQAKILAMQSALYLPQ